MGFNLQAIDQDDIGVLGRRVDDGDLRAERGRSSVLRIQRIRYRFDASDEVTESDTRRHFIGRVVRGRNNKKKRRRKTELVGALPV